jgi:hypothetical protein
MPAKAAAPAKKAAPKAAAPKAAAKTAAPQAAAPKKAAAPQGAGNGVYVSKWGTESAQAAKEAFSACGPITSVQIRRNKYALIFFETAAGAKKAIDTLNGKTVCGATVTITAAKTSPKKDAHQGSSVVFVGPFFPESTSRKTLIDLFKTAGKIQKVRTYANHTAFIYYDNAASAAKAVKDLNGKEVNQKALTVKPSIRSLATDKSKREHALTMIHVHNWKIAKTGHK